MNFQGNAEQAFEFYKSVLGTDYTGPMMRLGDAPADPDAPQLYDAGKRMIMHNELLNGVIDLPAPVRHAVEQLLTELGAGSAVHVLADDHDMTTQEVAKLLGLARPSSSASSTPENSPSTSPKPFSRSPVDGRTGLRQDEPSSAGSTGTTPADCTPASARCTSDTARKWLVDVPPILPSQTAARSNPSVWV